MRLLLRLSAVVSFSLLIPVAAPQSPAPVSSPPSVSPAATGAQPGQLGGSQPNVNITPRTRTPVADPNESITDRHADIRVDTTLVLIPVAVTDPMSRFVT